MVKIAAKHFVYHGTSSLNLQSILAEGLKFYAKHQVWTTEKAKDDTISRESFPGIYLTSNLMTAISSAGQAGGYGYGKDKAIVGVEIETQTPSVVLDEDHVSGQNYTFTSLYHVNPNGWWWGQWLQYQKHEAEQVARKWLEYYLKLFPTSKQYEPVNRINWLLPYAIPVIIGFAEIHFADYHEHSCGKWGKLRNDSEFPDVEKSHAIATARHRAALDIFLQKSNFLARRIGEDKYYRNIRIKEPISYSGANKIVLVVSIKYHGLSAEYYESVQIHYLSDPRILTDFIAQFRERVGSNFIIKDDKGYIYYDSPKELEKEANGMWTIKYANIEDTVESESLGDEGFIEDKSGRIFWGSRGAGCLFVRNHPKHGPQLLIVLRSPDVEEPNTWGISGGAIRPGQDDYQTALRETIEEIGGLPRFKKINQYTWRAPGGNFTFTTYILEVLPPDLDWTPKNLSHEVTAVKWISLSGAQMLNNLHFGLSDTLKDIGENIFQLPDSLATNLNWQIKLAIKDYICYNIKIAEGRSLGQKTLGFLLGLNPALLIGFLSWLQQQKHMTPQQISQMATENLPAIQQQAEEYKKEQTYEPKIFEQPKLQQTTQKPDTFSDILDMTLGFEGGYVDHPNDPGGETNYGITRNTYLQYLTRNGFPIKNVDMQNITIEHINAIYKQQFWDPIHGDKLPPIIARQMFDYAVSSGPKRPIKALQMAIGVKTDGVIGPQTMRALQVYIVKRGENNLAKYVLNERTRFLRELGKKYPQFRKGWMNRINQLRDFVE